MTSGDPAGIGPEIMARAAVALRPKVAAGELSLVLIGAARSGGSLDAWRRSARGDRIRRR
jgi:4-hydroxy-L-threonine phosphate dehydrogenase PdxA